MEGDAEFGAEGGHLGVYFHDIFGDVLCRFILLAAVGAEQSLVVS